MRTRIVRGGSIKHGDRIPSGRGAVGTLSYVRYARGGRHFDIEWSDGKRGRFIADGRRNYEIVDDGVGDG